MNGGERVNMEATTVSESGEVGVIEGPGRCPDEPQAAGPPWLDQVVPGPPPTNRGSSTPVDRSGAIKKAVLDFGLDYLKFTIFCSFDECQSLVDSHLLDRPGMFLPEGSSIESGWAPRASVGRWERLEDFGAGWIQIRSPKHYSEPYTVFEMKGEGCMFFQAHLGGFLRAVAGSGHRWNGKRVDPRWDGSPITPEMFDQGIRAGNFVSRCRLGSADRDWRNNDEGSTAYLGTRLRKSPKLVRVYDRRGFNRVENELHDEHANSLLRELVVADESRWSVISLGYLLATVDFREKGAATRIERAPRLPWWEHFVGEAEKVITLTKTPGKVSYKPLVIGLADEWVKRNRRALRRFDKALGSKWVWERVRAHSLAAGEINYSGEILSDSERAEVEALRVYQGSGLCGLDVEDLPF